MAVGFDVDLRNSRVPDSVRELKSFGVEARVHDPLADVGHAEDEYGIALQALESLTDLHALILAVPHAHYLQLGASRLRAMLAKGGAFVDVKRVLGPQDFVEHRYWSL